MREAGDSAGLTAWSLGQCQSLDRRERVATCVGEVYREFLMPQKYMEDSLTKNGTKGSVNWNQIGKSTGNENGSGLGSLAFFSFF